MGGVLSHNPALARLGQLVGPVVFHTVCMIGGMGCLNAAAKRGKSAAKESAVV